jgi:hypothetical protein
MAPALLQTQVVTTVQAIAFIARKVLATPHANQAQPHII